jgi:hypothetical protein
MGMSTDGIAFYGMVSAEEGLTLEDEDEKEYEEYVDYDIMEEVEERLIAAGLKTRIHSHCSDSYPMYLLAIGDGGYLKKGECSLFHASRGCPEKMDITVKEDWDKDLKKAAELIGWPKDEREIAWWVVSDMG